MSNIQYTIRGVSKELDRTLRLRAKKHNQSFNSVLVQTLQQGAGIKVNAVVPKTNLDWFYGSGGIGVVEQNSFEQQREVDAEAWDD